VHSHESVLRRQQVFGYTEEELRILIAPMAKNGAEAIGSMGTDTPVAVLSQRPRLLFDYFSQLFAQVTNPPLDAIREELVTSLAGSIGPEQNLLEPSAASCRQIVLPFPVLSNDDLSKIVHVNEDGDLPGFSSVTVHGLYPVNGGGEALRDALDRVRREVSDAIAAGARLIVLSDRDSTEHMAPIPSLLLTSAVHHHLIREKTRTRVGLVVEAGDAREVHHMALLIGYGAAAVNPYLAFESIEDLIATGHLTGLDPVEAVHKYVKAAGKGVLKVMSKMGISTIASYTGAQVFEALGPVAGAGRRVLHRHHLPARRHRPGGRRRGGGRAAPQGVPRQRQRARPPQARGRRRVPVAPRGRGAPVQPGDGLPAAALHPQPAVRRLQAVHLRVDELSARAARCAGCSTSAATGPRCRSTRSSR
jgi:glutamate synthase (NADPH/NADH) large chain